MIKNITINNFYGNKKGFGFSFDNNLTILTGDNGAGKTTLLNMIFNIMNGEFSNLFKNEFSNLTIDLDIMNYSNFELIESIEVVKKNNTLLLVNYITTKKKHYIQIKKQKNYFMDFVYEYLGENINFTINELKEDRLWGCSTLDELIVENEELLFINKLKKSLLYFPTYRRIDADILDLIEQNYELNNDIEIHELKKKIDNYPMNNRIVGINKDDIDVLFKNYSNETRKTNSEGLDKLLRKFIKELIEETTTTTTTTSVKRKELKRYNTAPDQLIDLSNNLGIKNIDEEAIKNYFRKQQDQAEFYQKDKIKLKFQTSISKENGDETDISEESKEYLEKITDLIFSNLISSSRNSRLIMRLIEIYGIHVKKLGDKTYSYTLLNNSFQQFFKNNINLNFENYNLHLSRNFDELSTGEKQLITLLAYIVLGTTKTEYRPLIIIDEPELSLHISWQLKLISNLLELSNANFLLATHSPYIANQKYSNNIWQIGDIDEY